MEVIRKLVTRIVVTTEGFDEVEDQWSKFKKRAGRLKKAVKGLIASLATLAVTWGSVAAAAGFAAVRFSEYSEEVIRNADALGMATDRYQQFRFAFQNLNASTDDMMDAFSTVTDRAQDALEGAKEYRKEFRRLGISMDEIRNKEPGKIFETYMTAAQQVVKEQDNVTAAVRLFGDDLGRRLIPALTSSAESFNKLTNRAAKTAIVMEEDLLRAGRAVRMDWRLFLGRLKGVGRYLGAELLPELHGLITVLDNFTKKMFEMNEAGETASGILEEFQNVVDHVSGQLTKATKFVTAFFDVMQGESDKTNKSLERLVEWIEIFAVTLGSISLGVALASLVPLVATLGSLFSALAGALTISGGTLAAILAALPVIVFIVEDIVSYFMGMRSATGAILKNFGESVGVLSTYARFVEENKRALKITGAILYETLDLLWDIVKVVGEFLWDALQIVLQAVIVIIQAFFDFIALVVSVGEIVGAVFKIALAGLSIFLKNAWMAIKNLVLTVYYLTVGQVLQFFGLAESQGKKATQSFKKMANAAFQAIYKTFWTVVSMAGSLLWKKIKGAFMAAYHLLQQFGTGLVSTIYNALIKLSQLAFKLAWDVIGYFTSLIPDSFLPESWEKDLKKLDKATTEMETKIKEAQAGRGRKRGTEENPIRVPEETFKAKNLYPGGGKSQMSVPGDPVARFSKKELQNMDNRRIRNNEQTQNQKTMVFNNDVNVQGADVEEASKEAQNIVEKGVETAVEQSKGGPE